jgi:DNA polymerase
LVDVIASLVRPCVWAPQGKSLGIVDYSQIEARALAWLAGDRDAVALFREGRDPYRALAARLFNVAPDAVTKEQRKLGKIAELGCGYGMGPERFAAQAQAGGVDWTALTITPEEVVEAWRDAHPAIAGLKQETSSGFIARREGLWQELQRAATTVARSGGRVEVGPLIWGRNGQCVVCRLPSGRNIIYREARLEVLPGQRTKRPGFTYLNSFGKREPSYGGKLAENVVQAICRDILAHALIELDAAGLPVVLHVHDEIVVELDSAAQLAEQQRIMTTSPTWAQGLPLACEGLAARRYTK